MPQKGPRMVVCSVKKNLGLPQQRASLLVISILAPCQFPAPHKP